MSYPLVNGRVNPSSSRRSELDLDTSRPVAVTRPSRRAIRALTLADQVEVNE